MSVGRGRRTNDDEVALKVSGRGGEAAQRATASCASDPVPHGFSFVMTWPMLLMRIDFEFARMRWVFGDLAT